MAHLPSPEDPQGSPMTVRSFRQENEVQRRDCPWVHGVRKHVSLLVCGGKWVDRNMCRDSATGAITTIVLLRMETHFSDSFKWMAHIPLSCRSKGKLEFSSKLSPHPHCLTVSSVKRLFYWSGLVPPVSVHLREAPLHRSSSLPTNYRAHWTHHSFLSFLLQIS